MFALRVVSLPQQSIAHMDKLQAQNGLVNTWETQRYAIASAKPLSHAQLSTPGRSIYATSVLRAACGMSLVMKDSRVQCCDPSAAAGVGSTAY